MNIDIKKVYYVVLMAVIVCILGYYVYTHEIFNNIVTNNTEGVNENCLEGYTDDGNGTCMSLDITKPDLNYKTIPKTIYEAEANSKDDCTSFEKYNANDKTCDYECNNEEKCASIEEKINKELDSWVDEVSASSTDNITENESGATNENILSQYTISKG